MTQHATLHVGLFARESDLLRALSDSRDLGLSVVDVYTPYPVHGVDELAGVPPSRLPALCLAGGVTGVALALGFEYWASSADWPLDVGGKPMDSLPAFVPVAFEVMVLLAGLATVAGMLLRRNLHPGRRPRLATLGTTDDRFAVVLQRTDAAVSDAALDALFERNHAVERRQLAEEDL